MEKPGPGVPHPQIIDRPELKSFRRHLFESLITASLWAIWAYWVLPIVTAVLWLFGVNFFAQQLFTKGAYAQLFHVLSISGIAFLAILAAEIAWISYNHFRRAVRRGERRKRHQLSPDRILTRFFNVDLRALKAVRHHSRIEVTLRDGKLQLPAQNGRKRVPGPDEDPAG
jgi:poly-beta-1,6-N-acetyl-D-glucosamine biosynthesis protein PgaD